MSKASAPRSLTTETHKPFRVRLPGFISEREVGLGDAIKRVTSITGIHPCGQADRAHRLSARVDYWLAGDDHRLARHDPCRTDHLCHNDYL